MGPNPNDHGFGDKAGSTSIVDHASSSYPITKPAPGGTGGTCLDVVYALENDSSPPESKLEMRLNKNLVKAWEGALTELQGGADHRPRATGHSESPSTAHSPTHNGRADHHDDHRCATARTGHHRRACHCALGDARPGRDLR